MRTIKIGDRGIGAGYPCFVIAEAGVNHNGSLDLALKMVGAAVRTGADAVKFQTFDTELVNTRDAPKAAYQIETTGGAESQFQMLKKLELSYEEHRELQAYCQKQGLLFLSSPFDEQSADFLEELNIPVFKIPSGEITNLPFLEHVARKQRPMIVSTGMSSLEEVKVAVEIIHNTGNKDLVLLHCVSAYPASPADVNLRAMHTMATAFDDVLLGYSDHTLGVEVALAAVALGAHVIEKHYTLDRNLPGPDHRASLEPEELITLVSGIRTVEAAMGHGRKEPAPCEAEIAAVARKSIVAAKDIVAGATITKDLVAMKCPGTGLPPSSLDQVIGRRAKQDIRADVLVTLEMLK